MSDEQLIDDDVYGYTEEEGKLYDRAGSNLLTPPDGAAVSIFKGKTTTKWSEVIVLRNVEFEAPIVKAMEKTAPGDATALITIESEVDSESTTPSGDLSPNVARKIWIRQRFNFTQHKANPESKDGQAKMTDMSLSAFKSLVEALGYDRTLGRLPIKFVRENRENMIGAKIVVFIEQREDPTQDSGYKEEMRRFAQYEG